VSLCLLLLGSLEPPGVASALRGRAHLLRALVTVYFVALPGSFPPTKMPHSSLISCSVPEGPWS
jgi:hypothetical protein